MSDLLRINNLKVEFNLPEGVVKAVDGVSLRIAAGSTVALVGESGSGKSVISQAVMGILPRTASITGGEILFDDPETPGNPIDIAKLPPDGVAMRKLRGSRISIIFQEPMSSLSPLHTIGDQISEVLYLHKKKSRAEALEIMEEMFHLIAFPNPKKAHRIYPFELSGGLRQRAMIAMALVCRPGLLIADEPTTALDVTIQAQILKLMKDLQAELGMAILMITHDLGVVANLAEEVVVIYRGKLMESGSVENIFGDAQHDYLRALLRAVPRYSMASDERLTPIRDIKLDKRHLKNLERTTAGKTSGKGTILDVRNVCKSFALRSEGWLFKKTAGFHKAVDDVSFHIKRGECVGLVGESGSGKSTTCKLILRALSADSGEIWWHGGGEPINLLELTGQKLLQHRRCIQYIFQDPFHSLNPRMPVSEIIGEPLVIHGIGNKAERMERVRTLMELVGLEVRHLSRYPHSFSGGQRQRIGIARALALHPDLLICDEPVSALDVSVQAQVLNLLKDLQQELGLTMLFVSHNLAVVHYVAERVVVMCAGHIVESASRDDLFSNPRHPYTQALLSAVPEPDLKQNLDFSAIALEGASDPATWPEPFRLEAGMGSAMREVSAGHHVRITTGGG
ncbi:MAG: ABC transporter ATP-binding protein [SAR324 cluster bacterium]|nr:ABC transporter ATP-binding protein [SAR324 cluster bacterium]